jgi:hypothetical protein
MIVYRLSGHHSDYPKGVCYDDFDVLFDAIKDCLRAYVEDTVGVKERYTIECIEMTEEEFLQLEDI